MALFQRKKPEPDLATVLLQGQDMIERTAAAHRADWGLGSADRYDVDLAAGTITWTFPDRIAVAPAQILGSHHAERGEWVWAWAIAAVPEAMRQDAAKARAYGETNGTPFLTSPQLAVDEAGAADVVATAFRIAESTGFYRGPGASSTYFTFGDVTVTSPDGTTRVFRLSVAD